MGAGLYDRLDHLVLGSVGDHHVDECRNEAADQRSHDEDPYLAQCGAVSEKLQ